MDIKVSIIISSSLAVIFLIILSLTGVSKFLSTFFSYDNLSPVRCGISVLLPILISLRGYHKKSLSLSGAMFASLVGFILTLGNYCFVGALLSTYQITSWATKLQGSKKYLMGSANTEHKHGRNWMQVFCNTVIAAECGVLYLADIGCREIPINFSKNYFGSCCIYGVLSSLCCCTGDCLASEIGSVYSNDFPVLITSWKKVPHGTNGAISRIGTLASILGGFATGFGFCFIYTLTINSKLWDFQSLLVILTVCCLSSFIGSIIDSFIGAILQYSGIEKNSLKIVDTPGPDVEWISGSNILSNHSVNLLSNLLNTLITIKIAVLLHSNLI